MFKESIENSIFGALETERSNDHLMIIEFFYLKFQFQSSISSNLAMLSFDLRISTLQLGSITVTIFTI